jgi:GntR family transcriptional regulator
MLIVVDHNSGVPVFRQLIEQVRFHVASGLLPAGAELPSTRTLSEELGVNPMTVSKAYALLEQDGLLERRPGLPLVVRALAGELIESTRLDQLRNVLQPAILAARQLGISPSRAALLFERMFDEAGRDEP